MTLSTAPLYGRRHRIRYDDHAEQQEAEEREVPDCVVSIRRQVS